MSTPARAVAALVLLGAMTCASAQPPRWTNVTAGGPLRPGVYGQIAVRGDPPPLVRGQPTTVVRMPERPQAPVYLYVPPGQLRRWDRHCAKWDACDRPVFFVRMDDSPSRLGAWKKPAQRGIAQPSSVLQALNRFAP